MVHIPVTLILAPGFCCSQREVGSRFQTQADARNPGLTSTAQDKTRSWVSSSCGLP